MSVLDGTHLKTLVQDHDCFIEFLLEGRVSERWQSAVKPKWCVIAYHVGDDTGEQ